MKKLLSFFILTTCVITFSYSQTYINLHQNNGTVLQFPLSDIDSVTYSNNQNIVLPVLTTNPIINITETSASSGGNVTNLGGSSITARGIVWSENQNPTLADNYTSSINIGNFVSNMTGLTSNTTYYVRAYATNSDGTGYGNELSFTTDSTGSAIVSNPGSGVTYNGYTYSSVILGNGQEWMVENLRTENYRNGDPIPNVTDATQWSNLTTGAWVHYDNDSMYENPYGKLYNNYAVRDNRELCPTGWKVPSSNDWMDLRSYLDPYGSSAFDLFGSNLNDISGSRMKETGTQHWASPNSDATNESGLTGLPGGGRASNGNFNGINLSGSWWTNSVSNINRARYFITLYDATYIFRNERNFKYGYSVRCLKE